MTLTFVVAELQNDQVLQLKRFAFAISEHHLYCTAYSLAVGYAYGCIPHHIAGRPNLEGFHEEDDDGRRA
jgi:hypothetical protein